MEQQPQTLPIILSPGPSDTSVSAFFEKFPNLPVVIEGPEFTVDRSYKWMADCGELRMLEKGVPLESLGSVLAERIQDKVADIEFRVLRRITETQFHTEDLHECAAEEHKYNRYSDVIPFKQTRVKISREPGSVKSEYINANYINSLQSDRRNAFIATQAPLSLTVETFWDMVYQENVELVVMLCEEGHSSSAIEYWPETVGESMDIWAAELKLTYLSKTDMGTSVHKREFALTNKAGNKRMVTQYHFHTWADNSGLSMENLEEVKRLVDIVNGYRSGSKRPVVVHCSAGCGRTGTFIAMCNIVTAVEELKRLTGTKEKPKTEYDMTPRVSVFSTVRKLREQRWTMVKTEAQYRSIYEFIKFYYAK